VVSTQSTTRYKVAFFFFFFFLRRKIPKTGSAGFCSIGVIFKGFASGDRYIGSYWEVVVVEWREIFVEKRQITQCIEWLKVVKERRAGLFACVV
jgi:hypothetical protein